MPSCSVKDLIFKTCNVGTFFFENLDNVPSIPPSFSEIFILLNEANLADYEVIKDLNLILI